MSLIDDFQSLVAQVPEFVQPLVIAAAGAVPFIEGEGAATIGIIGGINPFIAAAAGIIGNFACVAVLVLLSAGARDAVVTRHRARTAARVPAATAATNAGSGSDPRSVVREDDGQKAGRGSNRKAKFQRAFERFGVPGVSLLGPLLLPTHFTAMMLAAAGVGKARILVWQAVAIILWTVAIAVLITGVVSAVG